MRFNKPQPLIRIAGNFDKYIDDVLVADFVAFVDGFRDAVAECRQC